MSKEQGPGLEDYGIDDAVTVVNMFDQANTNGAIESLGSRGRLLKEAIENLRADLNATGKRTILDAYQAKSVIRPIRPEEVTDQKKEQFPDEVIQAFNELIAEKAADGFSKVLVKDVVARMVAKGLKRKDINKKGWLNVEDIFRQAGWKVMSDSPVGWGGESFEAYYMFESRSRR